MLRLLSGKKVGIITGLVVIDTRRRKTIIRSCDEAVYFRKFTEREISAYVRSGEPFDKAAAFAVQGLGALLIKKVEGDFWGAVGLPIYILGEVLKDLGVRTL